MYWLVISYHQNQFLLYQKTLDLVQWLEQLTELNFSEYIHLAVVRSSMPHVWQITVCVLISFTKKFCTVLNLPKCTRPVFELHIENIHDLITYLLMLLNRMFCCYCVSQSRVVSSCFISSCFTHFSPWLVSMTLYVVIVIQPLWECFFEAINGFIEVSCSDSLSCTMRYSKLKSKAFPPGCNVS